MPNTMSSLDLCKMALRVTTTAYDDQINNLIDAAEKDLGIAGVSYSAVDSLVQTAISTYVRMHFGDNTKDQDRLKSAYDEQKAQLQTASGYTDWSR